LIEEKRLLIIHVIITIISTVISLSHARRGKKEAIEENLKNDKKVTQTQEKNKHTDRFLPRSSKYYLAPDLTSGT